MSNEIVYVLSAEEKLQLQVSILEVAYSLSAKAEEDFANDYNDAGTQDLGFRAEQYLDAIVI